MLSVSAAPPRRCLGCPKKLPVGARTNQRYCGKKCRGREWARANRRQSTTITAADFAALQTRVERLAVGFRNVAGYSLSCGCPYRLRYGEVRFPQPTRKTKRFPSPDGRFRFTRSAFFRLTPFEPPRVPITGEYRLRFHREDGTEIVSAAQMIVTVEAAFPSVRFYDSEGDYDPKGRPVKPRPKKPCSSQSAPSADVPKPASAVPVAPAPRPPAAPTKQSRGISPTIYVERPAPPRSPIAPMSADAAPTRQAHAALYARRARAKAIAARHPGVDGRRHRPRGERAHQNERPHAPPRIHATADRDFKDIKPPQETAFPNISLGSGTQRQFSRR